MATQRSLESCGVIPMGRCQVGMVPGPQPQRGPTSTTGGSSVIEGSRITWSRATGSHQLKMAQWNAEGVRLKKLELQNFLRQNSIDICCVQETHLTKDHRFFIRGYETYRQDRENRQKGGILTLVKNSLPSVEFFRSGAVDTECLGVKAILNDAVTVTVYNVYSPPDKQISLQDMEPDCKYWVMLGDLNSHSPSWGYQDLDSKGEEVESWMISNQLVLINHPDDQHTYYSRAWRTTSTPDVAIATENLQKISRREVCPQLGGSDHRPVIIHFNHESADSHRMQPSWNYKKADWTLFTALCDEKCAELTPADNSVHQNIVAFNRAILEAAKASIPRGRRRNYKPFWSPQLQELEDVVSDARENMEKNPTDDNVIAHNKARAEFNRAKVDLTRTGWREKTASLNFESDSQRLWNLTKCLNEEQPARSRTVLELDGQLISGKPAANCLAQTYREQSTVEMPQERIREVHDQTMRKLQTPSAEERHMVDMLTMSELREAISRLKTKKAPGPDGISNDMLRHLGPVAKRTLLSIFNQSWETGEVPNIWKEALIIPILKKGKCKTSPNSYRPISLLSCVGKLLERVINKRLIWHLESKNLLTSTQTGYRQHRSTEDQLALLAQEVENAFQEKKSTVAVFFDLTQAFDRVWKKGLLLRLLEMGVSGHMYRWTKNLLTHRSARVKLDGVTSHRVRLAEGVPQGGVISPTLFLMYINGITTCVPRHVSNTLHADDFAVWSSSEHLTTATYRMQETVNNVQFWTEQWGLDISKKKTCSTVFSLSTKRQNARLKLGEDTIPHEDTPTFLGVKLDKRLTWRPHIDSVRTRAIRRLALMKKLAGTTWGANAPVLKQVYTGYVRPVMEYSSTAWSTSANTNKMKLDRVQNWGLRMVLGAMKTTPIADMEKTADIEPLENRRNTKVLLQGEKMRRLTSHPLHNRLNEGTKNRLKRKSPNHLFKTLRRPYEDVLQASTGPCERLEPERWLGEDSFPDVRTTLPGITSKEDQIPAAQQALALEYLEREYPSSSWIRAYTDGSATDATRKGGSGVYIQYPDQQAVSLSLAVGEICTNFKAEVKAITAAADHLSTSQNTGSSVVILTDSLSAMQALSAKNPDAATRELQDSLQRLAASHTAILQWIPAHCGIQGNEKADSLAKEGSRRNQPVPNLSFHEAKTLVKHRTRTIWRSSHRDYNYQQDSLHSLSRNYASTIYRLRTGHCGLRAHLWRLRLTDTALCPCTQADQTPAHILQDCPLYTAQRNQTWPEGADLNTKLWGTTIDLERTAQFVTSVGLRI